MIAPTEPTLISTSERLSWQNHEIDEVIIGASVSMDMPPTTERIAECNASLGLTWVVMFHHKKPYQLSYTYA